MEIIPIYHEKKIRTTYLEKASDQQMRTSKVTDGKHK
jgi:hypothetical protein